MAESSVSYLLNRFSDFLRTEIQNLGDVHGEVISAKESLERIKAHLQVAESLEETDHEVEVWIKQIRDAAHEMEDALDEFQLAFAMHQGVGIWSLLFQLPTFTRNVKVRYRVINELKRATARIESVCEGHKRLRRKFGKVQQRISNETDGHWQDHRGDALLIDKTDLVGIEERKRYLVQCLIEGTSEREAVSMYGMGGLGKTTLAKQVYEDPTVKKHFSIRVWITLSSSSKKELLKELLQQIVKQTRKADPWRVDTSNRDWLKMMIKSCLLNRRYLIVLDDIWNISKWDEVKYAFPSNGYGSRVIVTTRKQDVASASHADFGGTMYELKPLPDEESWKLFCKKTFQGGLCPSNLEETCKSILIKCEGLPLPIIAISGVLASKDVHRIDEWDLIKRSLRAEIDGNHRLKKIEQVLSLSFKDLPYYLKSCFLHLSVFPEGDEIKRMRLIRLWIAEGFIEAKEGRTLEEVAGDYFDELMNRSLLQLTRTTNDGRVKECRIHHLLQQIAIQKSRDQNFAVRVEEQNASWPDKVRRLSVHYRLQLSQLDRSLTRLRSLYAFGVEKSSIKAALLCVSKLLTVLEVQAVPNLRKFPPLVFDMYFLRYLSLRFTEVKTVPSSIGKLQNLETLDLKHTYVTELPVEIVKLKRLRHLLVYRYESVSYSHLKYGFSTSADMGSLQSLQKLSYLDASGARSHIIVRDIGKLTQLRRLCILNLRKKDGAALYSSISKLTNLVSLAIYSLDDDEVLNLQDLRSPPPLLLRVYLKGRLLAMPHWIPTLQSLNTVHLQGSWLKDDPLLYLQNMPNLVVLELQKT
ncbi:hypothetical protein SAY86_011058 [Trapa natans]|uniref:Disease resistance protein RPM1-like n=1 Tax=Trapa natans TaxID=22666 RepID=A0AAN7LT85_TRANT|nr:hypothetical protein SAY86_011058 [Trapa natans]